MDEELRLEGSWRASLSPSPVKTSWGLRTPCTRVGWVHGGHQAAGAWAAGSSPLLQRRPEGGQTKLFSPDTRSRLADFHANCRTSYQTLTSCPADNYQACLGSYAGMIGFDMTPNYVDSSPTSIVVSPWCSCRGSGNMEEECEKFLRDFTENPCLRNAIQAFGNGTDVNLSPKNPSFQATQAPRVEKTPSLPDDLSDSTSLGTSLISTCTSIQEQGLKANNSKELSMCFTELTTNIIPGRNKVIRPNSGPCRARPSAALTAVSLLMLKLALSVLGAASGDC
ncbi:GDNF family receptor alpha-2-like [Diceros bicornis minor]|uniref:GDNF family receptor alpha-2-like n=1 Tax=Diceros bicornis minor TaxID=77932 RepID=UPI0026EB40BD|nr:GDNF family receptor alpha-2-like [Diceros bicornis minor]